MKELTFQLKPFLVIILIVRYTEVTPRSPVSRRQADTESSWQYLEGGSGGGLADFNYGDYYNTFLDQEARTRCVALISDTMNAPHSKQR